MKFLVIKEKVIFYSILFFWMLFHAAVFFSMPVVVSAGITLPFLLLLPGWFVYKALALKLDDGWGKLVTCIGFSLTFLMACGFAANMLLPLVGIREPLAPVPFLCVFNISFVILFNIVQLKRRIPTIHITIPRFSIYTPLPFLAPLLFPLVATLGAIDINNTGSTILTLLLLGSIVEYILAVLLFRKSTPPYLYSWALYCIGLALLLMTSLRGWYITGHDIQLEYHVFQLTKHYNFWNISALQDAYNACLSITILPTILANLSHIPDPYIYKIVFQVLFAFSPVAVFLYLRKYTNTVLAFFSAVYFLSFPTFFNDMPMLNRQEIAFLFFFLLLYVLFNNALEKKQKNTAALILACSLVVSHYATTYIVLGLFLPVYAMRVILQNRFVIAAYRKVVPQRVLRHANTFTDSRSLSGSVLITLVVFTFLWNSQLTKTAGGLVETVTQTLSSMHTAFKADNKSADISYSIFSPRVVDDAEFTKEYVQNSVAASAKKEDADSMYPPATYADYIPEIKTVDKVPLTNIGAYLNHASIDVFHVQYTLRQSAAKILQLFIILGLIGLFFYKPEKPYDSEYVWACGISVAFIILMTILPQLSLQYGLLRLFAQFMVFLSLPLLIGNLMLLRFLNKNAALHLAATVTVVFFLTVTGFFSEVTGGYIPQLNLNNAGIYYDAYYLFKTEIFSARWLDRNMNREFALHADTLASNKLFAVGDIHLIQTIFPAGLRKSAYVFAGRTNTNGHTIISVDRSLMVSFPLPFLENNKNIIYDNGGSRIYK